MKNMMASAKTMDLAERFVKLIPLYVKCQDGMKIFSEISGGATTGDKDKDTLCCAMADVCEAGRKSCKDAFDDMMEQIEFEDNAEDLAAAAKDVCLQTSAKITANVSDEQIRKIVGELI